jgi:hypothetical protein
VVTLALRHAVASLLQLLLLLLLLLLLRLLLLQPWSAMQAATSPHRLAVAGLQQGCAH